MTFTTPITRHLAALGSPGGPRGRCARGDRPVPVAPVPSVMSVTLCAGWAMPQHRLGRHTRVVGWSRLWLVSQLPLDRGTGRLWQVC